MKQYQRGGSIKPVIALLALVGAFLGTWGVNRTFRNEQLLLETMYSTVADAESSTRVGYNAHAVGSGPFYSEGISNCVSCVLLSDDGIGGLSHYDFDVKVGEKPPKPEEYLGEMISSLEKRGVGKNELEAIVVGGATNHFIAAREYLGGQGIPIIKEYCDNHSMEVEPEKKKSIAIDARTNTVILFTGKTYQRLH